MESSTNNSKEDINFNELEELEDKDEEDKEEFKENLLTVDPDIIEIQKLRLSIMRYKQLFPNHLILYGDRLTLENLEKLTQDQLQRFLDEVKITVGSRNSASMITTSYMSAMGLAETLGPKLNMKLQGLQASLMNNQMIMETLTEISLEYESLAYINPIQRLAIQTGQHILFLHQQNKANEQKEIFLKENTKKEIVEEFKDI